MLTDNTIVPPRGTAGQGLTPEAVESIAIRRIFDGDPLALACHALGLASRAQPQPMRLHPDDLDYIVRQLAVELRLGEQTAEIARAAQKGAQRFTSTALGDRAAAGRTNNPYPIHMAQELNDIEKQQEGRAA